MRVENILFGAAYYDEYMPYDRIEEDFKLMKDGGFNVIRIAESTWSTWEPEEGVFDFTHLHRMLDAAAKYDLKVIIGTPTYAIPAWLYKKHPDILAVGKKGPELYGHRQLNDLTNPHYLKYAERIIRKLMEEVKEHPQVIGYQLDNETRSAGAASPETQALFVRKMKEKYPDIEAFNHEFGLDYWSNRIGSWEDFPDIRGTINGSLSAAYKRFLRDVITEFLAWQADIVREYKKDNQFITHNFDYSWTTHSFGIQPEVNQFDAARCMDVAGVDIYHPTQDKLTGVEIAFGGAVGRSLKKGNYLVLETEAQGQTDWLAYPGQLRLQAYSHLASGANSVMYWHWHSIHNSFESYWKGILSHDLLPNATYKELSAWRKEMLPFEAKLRNLKKTCGVAILVDNASLTGLDEFPTNLSNPLEYNRILRRIYDSLYEMNIECDLLSVNDSFDGFSFLIVPALYSASEETLLKIKSYIENGGHALITFKTGFSDEELKIYHDAQPHMLTECIGAAYDQFTNPSDVTISIDGKSYSVENWMELLRPADCEILASYEHKYWKEYAALTCKKYGRGNVCYLGCFMEKDGFKALFKKLLPPSGVTLPSYAFPLIRKSGTNEEGNLIQYFFNYSSEPVRLHYTGKQAVNLLTGETISPDENKQLAPWDLIIAEETDK